jgi:hypothetical protein
VEIANNLGVRENEFIDEYSTEPTDEQVKIKEGERNGAPRIWMSARIQRDQAGFQVHV